MEAPDKHNGRTDRQTDEQTNKQKDVSFFRLLDGV